MAQTWLCQKVEDMDERLLRMELSLDRIGMTFGAGARLLGSTWEVSEHQIAQWVSGTTVPLVAASSYVRFKDGSLEIRGGSFSIHTGEAGAHMTMTGDEMIAYDAGDAETFNLDFTTGALVLTGTITAAAGVIGGWTITAAAIEKLTANVGIQLASGTKRINVGDLGGNYILIDGVNNQLGVSNFSSGVSGWRIDGSGDAEFNNIVARGVVRTPVFLKDEVAAIGGTFLVNVADVITTDATTAAAINGSFSLICDHSYFSVNDYIRCKPDGVKQFWGLVTARAGAGPYTYTVTLKDGDTSTTFEAGLAVVGYGANGTGSILLTGTLTNAPYMSIFTHAAEPWNALTEKVRVGALTGITDAYFGALAGYGIWTDTGYFTGGVKATSGDFATVNISGVLTMLAGGEIRVGDAGDPGDDFNGLRMYQTADPFYRLEGQAAGVVQFYVDNTGKLRSGTADNYVSVEDDGLWIYCKGASYNMKFYNSDEDGTYASYAGFITTSATDPNANDYGTLDVGVYHDDDNQVVLQMWLNEFQFAVEKATVWTMPLQGFADHIYIPGKLAVGEDATPDTRVHIVGTGDADSATLAVERQIASEWGPYLSFSKSRAALAAAQDNDSLGGIFWRVRNSTPAWDTVAQLWAKVLDVTAGTEDSQLEMSVWVGGAETLALTVVGNDILVEDDVQYKGYAAPYRGATYYDGQVMIDFGSVTKGSNTTLTTNNQTVLTDTATVPAGTISVVAHLTVQLSASDGPNTIIAQLVVDGVIEDTCQLVMGATWDMLPMPLAWVGAVAAGSKTWYVRVLNQADDANNDAQIIDVASSMSWTYFT